jgi:hypothetical protein
VEEGEVGSNTINQWNIYDGGGVGELARGSGRDNKFKEIFFKGGGHGNKAYEYMELHNEERRQEAIKHISSSFFFLDIETILHMNFNFIWSFVLSL